MTETNIVRTILLAFGKVPAVRIFRNNTATGWAGKSIGNADGSRLVLNPFPLRAGLCEGSSDLIGLQAITITPEMVGTVIGRFIAVEVKKPGGRIAQEQHRFIEMVNNFGGKAFVAKDEFEAVGMLTQI